MNDDIDADIIGTAFFNQHFQLDEAVDLLNMEAIRTKDTEYLPSPPIDKTGIICGVVTMNEYVEIIIKYPEGILQLNKTEFYDNNLIIDEKKL